MQEIRIGLIGSVSSPKTSGLQVDELGRHLFGEVDRTLASAIDLVR